MSTRPDPERDARLLAQLDEETARLLFPERFSGPIEISLLFPPLEGEAAGEAAESLRAAASSETSADGRTHATFELGAIEALHTLYGIIDRHVPPASVDILLDGKKLPLTRELWLPLLWNLRA